MGPPDERSRRTGHPAAPPATTTLASAAKATGSIPEDGDAGGRPGAAAAYRSSPIKRRRRTKAEVGALKAALYDLVADERPMTVRQVFYRAVAAGLVAKTEAEYKATICRLLGDMRRRDELPFEWLADNTRWMRKPASFSSLDGFLASVASHYRRAVWDTQDVYVEVWLEKDALAGVLYQVTGTWDVPLMITRGYPSLTFLHSAAEAIRAEQRPAFLYYFGDWDPSGVDIPRKVERDLQAFAPTAEIHFERVAVNPDQIHAWSLPIRPTKTSDTRSRTFHGESVEVDAIPPTTLRELVEPRIQQHVDHGTLELTLRVEEEERATLARFAASRDGEAPGHGWPT
jgi:hypothetical protein